MAFSAEIRVVEDNIISLLKNKDQRGMEILYDKFGNVIYGFLYQVLQSDEIAETALDEVFLRVWRNIDMYDSKKMRLLTWVIGFARQNAHQKLKNPQLNKSTHSQTKSINFSDCYNPEASGIKEIIKQLDKKQKQTLEQIYFEGKELNEISHNSDLPVNNLKSMVRSVLKMLQVSPLLVNK